MVQKKRKNCSKFSYNEKLANESWRILSVYPQYPTWPGARPYKHSTHRPYIPNLGNNFRES
jgi:hypothetical protein